MNFKELKSKQEAVSKAVSDSAFSKCVDCRGEGYINLSIKHGEDFKLSMASSYTVVSVLELIELRNVLNELFPPQGIASEDKSKVCKNCSDDETPICVDMGYCVNCCECDECNE